ncbi:Tn3 family transposase [Hymenobacter sp. BT664]|uniref:Tn3 family transposase n=1 Tax=Hymenobacter montanus TaxID=2771359 RepID=A0A927B9J6_9BACT|nr:Tn3 family transposase [Hymenobacter montanus]MBD2766642.1 Tn3 family transposase [Hymenobacter montanus]
MGWRLGLTAYALSPVKRVDRALIEAQWDTLLRLVVSLKQKHVTASTVLLRLNSYSQHHPVYLALRELGRAVRTEFLLRYMDDQDLRQRIDDQLDKLESAHSFARAVFYGQNGQIPYAGKEEQQLADACKRLVQNALQAFGRDCVLELPVPEPVPTPGPGGRAPGGGRYHRRQFARKLAAPQPTRRV